MNMEIENKTEFFSEEKVNIRFEKLESKVETLTESSQKILSTRGDNRLNIPSITTFTNNLNISCFCQRQVGANGLFNIILLKLY